MTHPAETTYTVEMTFTVHPETDSHLQTQQAILDEMRSWLEGLNATVHDIRFVKLTKTLKEGGR